MAQHDLPDCCGWHDLLGDVDAAGKPGELCVDQKQKTKMTECMEGATSFHLASFRRIVLRLISGIDTQETFSVAKSGHSRLYTSTDRSQFLVPSLFFLLSYWENYLCRIDVGFAI